MARNDNNWTRNARKLGARKSSSSRAFLGDDQEDENHGPGLLYVLAEKYPNACRKSSASTSTRQRSVTAPAWHYAKIVAEAKLPDAAKQKVLEDAARDKNRPSVIAAGIYYLRRFDPKLAKELLLKARAIVPDDETADAALASTVAEGTDVETWQALARATQRVNESGRIDMVCAVSCAKTPEGRMHRIAFLTEYLVDELTPMCRGPCRASRSAAHRRDASGGPSADRNKAVPDGLGRRVRVGGTPRRESRIVALSGSSAFGSEGRIAALTRRTELRSPSARSGGFHGGTRICVNSARRTRLVFPNRPLCYSECMSLTTLPKTAHPGAAGGRNVCLPLRREGAAHRLRTRPRLRPLRTLHRGCPTYVETSQRGRFAARPHLPHAAASSTARSRSMTT